MDPTKEQHQMLCKSRKKCDGDPGNDQTSVRGRKHEKSKLTETEKGETGEEQSQEHAHHFDIKGIVHKEFVMARQMSILDTTLTFMGLHENV
jgi:hypothetical protein